MKITVKHKDTKVTVNEVASVDKSSYMHWSDQCERIKSVIICIADEIKKLNP